MCFVTNLSTIVIGACMLCRAGIFSITDSTPSLTANLAGAAGGMVLSSGILSVVINIAIDMEIRRLKDAYVPQQRLDIFQGANNSNFMLVGAFNLFTHNPLKNPNQQTIDRLNWHSKLIGSCNLLGTLTLVLSLFVASEIGTSVIAFGLLSVACIDSLRTIAELRRSEPEAEARSLYCV